MKAIAAGGKTPSAPPSPPEDKDLDARMKAVAQGNNYDNFQVSPGNEPKTGPAYDIREHPEDYNKMTTAQKVVMAPAMLQPKIEAGFQGMLEGLGQLDENPVGTLYRMITGIPGAIYNPLHKIHEGRTTGDTDKLLQGITDFGFQTVPTVLGAKGFVEAPGATVAELGRTAAGMPNQAAMIRATPKELGLQRQNLGYAIQQGIKEGAGIDAAGVYEPYAQSFLKRAGVHPEDILPAKGDALTLAQGGPKAQLGKLNAELQREWVASGKSAESFVPHTDVHMAIADGAVNEAHAPIANAIRATAGVKIDGSTPRVANIQKQVVDQLRASQAALSPSQHAELDLNYNRAIEDVLERGGTIGGMDSIRRDWNSGMTRFYSGTPTAMSNADASSARVWRDGNDIIRKNLYPALEDLTERPGATHSLRQAGINESTVIQGRDGIFLQRVQSANLAASNTAIKNYVDYLTEGRGLYNRGLSAPVSTALNYGSRILGKSNAMGDFNTALRKGLGNFSDFRLMDASAFPKKQLTTGTDTSGPIPIRPGQIQNRIAAPAPPPDTSGPIPIKVQDIVAGERKLLPRGPIMMGAPETSGQTVTTGPPLQHEGGYPESTVKQSGRKAPKVGGTAGELLSPTPPPAPAPPPAETGYPKGEPGQTGSPTPKAQVMPASAKDYFSAVAADEAKAAPAKTTPNRPVKVGTPTPKPPPEKAPAAEPVKTAPPEKTTAPAKTEVKPPAAPKKAAPAKPKAEAKAPTPPPKPSDTAELKGPTVGDLVRQKEKLDDYVTNNPDHDPQVLDGLRKESAKLDVQIKKAIGDKSPTKPVEVSMKPETKAAAPAPPPAAPKVEAKPAAAPADDIEALKAKVKALEKEANSTPVVKAEAKPKAATAPKRAAAPKAPPQPVAQRPSMDVLRKRGVVTGDDLVHLASNGDREAGIALAKAESLHLNPNDAEALTNMYLNEFDSADLPGDIKDLHARVGRRFTKGK
jgi:hypothetical protein